MRQTLPTTKQMTSIRQKDIYTGIGLAVLAAIIWSGNFIVAKAVNKQIPPVALNFYRWLLASVIMLSFAWKKIRAEWPVVRKSFGYLFWISLMGISLFNSFVYVGAHYTSATNLALIGTTSSPILSILFARIFLNERIGLLKITGMILCITGVLYLLSKGNWENLLNLHFSKGDLWVLLAAFCFAVYNTMVKKKPGGISPVNFLFTIFSLGTLLALPVFIWESQRYAAVSWNSELVLSVVYLGLGASVICFLIWNKAIRLLGAGRTALFGNLIPVFSSMEAALILNEQFTGLHITSMLLIFMGILLFNLKN